MYITNRDMFASEAEYFEKIEQLVSQGIWAVQLREPRLTKTQVERYAVKIKTIIGGCETKLIINSYSDIALRLGASGFQLNHRSKADFFATTDFISLFSAHSLEEGRNCLHNGYDYITVSPVFYVPGKGKALGAEYLLEFGEELKSRVFALGGINSGTIALIHETGVGGVAFSRAALDNGFVRQINNEQTKRKLA